MNSFQLKFLACTCMLIDHIGAIIFPEYIFFRIIGRLAFPIFAWMIAVGYEKTSNKINYMKRLGAFALISQVPFSLAFGHKGLNVFFTLFLGLMSIYYYNKIEEEKKKIIPLIGFIILSTILNTDYSAYGVLTIFFFYKYKDDFEKMVKSQVGLNAYLVAVYALSLFLNKMPMTLEMFLQALSLGSLFLIKKYNGEQGKKLKYFFYAFYPIHLLAIYSIKFFIK